MKSTLGSSLLVVCSLLVPGVSLAQTNVVKTISGKYLYQTLKEHRPRGSEEWVMTKYVDGSRTVRMMVTIDDTGVQRDVVLTVDPSYRPKEAYTRLWVKGKYVGSAVYSVQGDKLDALVITPNNGRITQEVNVPQNFSFVAHPIAGDGWHFWYYNQERGGEQDVTVYNPDTLGAGTGSLLGVLQSLKAKFIDDEETDVPAGKYPSRHYELGGVFNIWVSGEDHVMVRMTLAPANAEYLLAECKTN